MSLLGPSLRWTCTLSVREDWEPRFIASSLETPTVPEVTRLVELGIRSLLAWAQSQNVTITEIAL